MDHEIEDSYGVPSHLKESGSVGSVPSRVLILFLAVIVLGAPAGMFAWLNTEEIQYPLLIIGGIFLVLLPFGAWWQDPPVEHGLGKRIRHKFLRKDLGPQHLRLRKVSIERDVIWVDGEPRAVLAMPTVNLELASVQARRRHLRQLGKLLDGLSAYHVQIVVRGVPLPKFDSFRRMRLHTNPMARRIADWLEEHYEKKEAVARPRYLIVPAKDVETLESRLVPLLRSMRQIGMEPERITDPDELKEVLDGWWTWQPHPERLGPIRVTHHADCLEIDSEWVQVWALGKMPPSILTDWWSGILDGDLAVDVTMNLEQETLWWAKQRLDFRINDLASSWISPGRELALEQARDLRKSLESSTRPWKAEILFTVRGVTQAAMTKRANALVQQMKDLGGSVRLLKWEQLEGFENASPLSYEEKLDKRALFLETGTIARSTPLSASTLQVGGGVPWGFAGQAPILFTLRQLKRVLHMGWYGVPGAGKGFGLRVLLARRHFAERLRLFIWDNDASHHEYSGRFTEFLGGHTYTPHSLDELMAFEIDPLWNMLSLDATMLDYKDLGQAFAVWTRKVEEHCLAFRGPAAFVIDEATDIAEHPDQAGAHALSRAVTHWRKNGIECHVVTQRVSDWFKTSIGEKVQGSLAAKWYGQMEPTELTKVAERIGLSPEEKERIEGAGVGQGLLVAYGRRVWADLFEQAAPDEYAMAHTDPPESVEIVRQREVA